MDISKELIIIAKRISAESAAESRENRIKSRVEKVVENLDKGSDSETEYQETLEYGNSWTMEWENLIDMMMCYELNKSGSYFGKPWGNLDRDGLIKLMTKTLYDAGKDFEDRNENSIYAYEFEAEHDGDVRGICEELESAGANVIKTKADFDEETGYAFFTVKNENVERFEKAMGKLWTFKKVK